jgi:hypothetical protein
MSTLRRNRLTLFLSLFLVLTTAVAAHAAPKLADYPLRVRIFQNHWNGSDWNGYRGFGRANLIDGDQTNAMEYTFLCEDHFTASDPGEGYPAKWKKQGQELEMLLGIIGTDKVHKCTMKTTLKDFVFVRRAGVLGTITQAEFKDRQAKFAQRAAALAPADANNSHYPLHLSILNLNWGNTVAGLHSGMGQGNLTTPAGVSAVDFSLSCPVSIDVNPIGRYYLGRWQAEGSRMSLLLHKLGDPTAAATCDLKTIVHTDVYVRRSTGDLQAVSQAQYKDMEKTETTAPSQQ